MVKIREVDEVLDHPNADRMKIARVGGWQVCVAYNPETGEAAVSPGDLCVYFPPDAVLPPELANGPEDEPKGRLNVKKYLNMLPKNEDGTRPPGGRVKAARLRGVESFGVLMKLDTSQGDDPTWKVGDDVADHFGVTKWEPPVKTVGGDILPEHPRFHTYTDIENIRNFPDVFKEGETVIMTEKIHGTNSRLGAVLDSETGEWEYMAGSHGTRRKEIDDKGRRSMYWEPMTDKVKSVINSLVNKEHFEPIHSVLVFGEIYGSGVQDMKYGLADGQKGFRVFDIAINGVYMDYEERVALLDKYGVESVPVLYKGPFSLEVLEEHTNGPTTLCDEEDAGKFKGREGVVIVPIKERYEEGDLNGRCILKSISADYLARKGGTDSH